MTPREVLDSLDDFQAWRRGSADFDLLDYLMCVATPDVLVAMMELVHPALVEFEGRFFIKSRFDEGVYRQWVGQNKPPDDIQKMMNHLHVSSFMQGQLVSNDAAVFFARRLAEVWSRVFAPQGLVAKASGTDFNSAQVTLFGAAVAS